MGIEVGNEKPGWIHVLTAWGVRMKLVMRGKLPYQDQNRTRQCGPATRRQNSGA